MSEHAFRSRRLTTAADLDVRSADLQEEWRNNASPFRQLRRRRRHPSEHRRERSEQSNTARDARAARARIEGCTPTSWRTCSAGVRH